MTLEFSASPIKERWRKYGVGQDLGILRSNRRSHRILQYPTLPTLSYRSGYLTYRTDALVQTAKPTLGAYLGHRHNHFFLFQSTEEHLIIGETAFLKIYLWPISVLIIHNVSFITLICFIVLPIYSATVDYFQLIAPLWEQFSWHAVLTCFLCKSRHNGFPPRMLLPASMSFSLLIFLLACIRCVSICCNNASLQSAMIPSQYISLGSANQQWYHLYISLGSSG